uniref:CUB domain-containing protein n=1 Tax=Meloidogyne incognita TaxID=6306 RepID=A0A914KZ08_MELIC
MIYDNLTFILLHLQLLITISAESSDSNNDCSCPKEEIFDSNVKEGVFKSPGFPLKYCGSLDCKWNIQSAENTFIYAKLKSFEFTSPMQADELAKVQTNWPKQDFMK